MTECPDKTKLRDPRRFAERPDLFAERPDLFAERPDLFAERPESIRVDAIGNNQRPIGGCACLERCLPVLLTHGPHGIVTSKTTPFKLFPLCRFSRVSNR